VFSLALLFTMIMKAMVMPRRASREMRRRMGAAVESGPETGLGEDTVVVIDSHFSAAGVRSR
jgi:hypothetical protein